MINPSGLLQLGTRMTALMGHCSSASSNASMLIPVCESVGISIALMSNPRSMILCSSFTKTVAPGLRVGWIVPGRYYDRVMHMKYAAGGFNVPGTQMAVAAFIRDGHYHRHVRRMRQIYHVTHMSAGKYCRTQQV